jgi:hypothetical protein
VFANPTHGPAQARRSIFAACSYTTREESYSDRIIRNRARHRRRGAGAGARGSLGCGPLPQPLRLPPGQAEEGVHRAPVVERQPAPPGRPGALALVDGAPDVGRDPARPGQPVLLGIAHGEGRRERVAHDVDPTQLPVAHPVLPGPAPRRAHVADDFGDAVERGEPRAEQLESRRGHGGELLERRAGVRRRGLVV